MTELAPLTNRETLAEALAPPLGASSGLAATIAAISSQTEAVPKLGLNDFHKFTFARMPDLMRILGPLMAQHGVVVMQSEVDHELIADGVLRVAFDFHIIHAPSGERHTIRLSGMAKVSGDRGGCNDRAIQAIATTTRKYVLIALFGVVVDDMPDNDHASTGLAQSRRRAMSPNKRDALPAFNQLRHDLERITSVGDLQQWGDDNGVTIASCRPIGRRPCASATPRSSPSCGRRYHRARPSRPPCQRPSTRFVLAASPSAPSRHARWGTTREARRDRSLSPGTARARCRRLMNYPTTRRHRGMT